MNSTKCKKGDSVIVLIRPLGTIEINGKRQRKPDYWTLAIGGDRLNSGRNCKKR